MGKKKRTNPRRIPATQADVNRAKREAIDQAIDVSWAISINVLRDKFGFGNIRIHRYWDEVNKLSEEIAEKRVSVVDLMDTIRDEAGIRLQTAAEMGVTENGRTNRAV